MNITTIQADLIWENKAANLQKFDNLLRGVTETDIIVLPEMFTTGFSMNPAAFAEPLMSETFEWMRQKALDFDAAITGSFICVENGKYYNRLLWIQPDGTYFTYDKRHLFTLVRENDHYTEGGSRIIIPWRGWQVCPLICYDLRFPVWSRNVSQSFFDEKIVKTDYYDLLIYVANWPQRRNHAWKSLLMARAIENQAYVVGVNRVGEDGNGVTHSGDTSVIDYAGEILLSQPHNEGIHTAILSKSKMTEFRHKFGFLNDGDNFKIDIK
jgi:omega-amidase